MRRYCFFLPLLVPPSLSTPPRRPARAGRWVVLLLLSCAAAGPRRRKVPRGHAHLLSFPLFLSARVGPPLPPLPFPHPLLACFFPSTRVRACVRACVRALVPANNSTWALLDSRIGYYLWIVAPRIFVWLSVVRCNSKSCSVNVSWFVVLAVRRNLVRLSVCPSVSPRHKKSVRAVTSSEPFRAELCSKYYLGLPLVHICWYMRFLFESQVSSEWRILEGSLI